jgi:hypothetical protein
LDTPGASFIAKHLIVRELNMYFSKLRKEDENISFEMLKNFTEEEVDKLCFMRGIEIYR